MSEVRFTVYGSPMPQGSMKAFVDKRSGQARMKPNNSKMLPYRQEVAQTAALECRGKVYAKHVPVQVEVEFYLAKPSSCPKKRVWPAVKPDVDKLIRLILDAMTGIAFLDDGQVCRIVSSKHYGVPERTEIRVTSL